MYNIARGKTGWNGHLSFRGIESLPRRKSTWDCTPRSSIEASAMPHGNPGKTVIDFPHGTGKDFKGYIHDICAAC